MVIDVSEMNQEYIDAVEMRLTPLDAVDLLNSIATSNLSGYRTALNYVTIKGNVYLKEDVINAIQNYKETGE